MDAAAWKLIFVVPTIVGLVELARRAGLGPVASSALAVALGLAVWLAYAATAGASGPQDWLDAVVQGVTIGLVASGLAHRLGRPAGERP